MKASWIGSVDPDSGVRESISILVRSAGVRAAVSFLCEGYLSAESQRPV